MTNQSQRRVDGGSNGAAASPLRQRRWAVLACTALVAVACGSDSSGPDGRDIVGQWEYLISDAVGVGVNGACNMTGISLAFSRSGGSLVGTVTAAGGNNLVCASGGTTTRDVSGTATLSGIVLNGSDVTFSFNGLTSDALSSATPVASTGSLNSNGSLMTGTVTFELLLQGADARPYTGNWTAVRR